MLKKNIFNLLTFFVAIFVSIILLEVLLRVLNFDPWILYESDLDEPTTNKYDTKIGWKPKEGIYIFPPKTADANSTTFTILKDGSRFNGKPIFVPERPQEVKVATCSAEKSRKLLNYSTKTKLKESIKYTANYIRKMGTRPFKYYLPVEIVNEKTPEAWVKKLI